MQRLCLFASSFFFLSHLYAASAVPLKIESIQFKAKKVNIYSGEPIVLPFIIAKQPKIAKKINDYIYIQTLKTLAPNKAKDGISRKITEADDDPMAGVTSMQYKTLLNDGKVLSLQFNSEFCGAYCEENTTNYSFDAATGRHITLLDLFTDKGLQALGNKVYLARVATMRQQIKYLKNQPAKRPTNDDDFEPNAADQILLYETCLAENAEMHKDEMSSGDTHELAFFSIDAKGLTFTHERCSNHAMRALDSIDGFNNHFTFQLLKPYFTGYAKQLLLNDTAKFEQPNNTTGQVYYGNIGLAPITLLINPPEGYDRMLGAIYFYDKYRQPIELSGTGGTWTETNSTDKPQPTIKATWQADVATGQWQGNGKTLPFKIAP
jgi:hypothetical protein